MKEKVLRGFFGFLLLTLFITFFTLYLFEATGYGEFAARKKVIYTNEQIKQFEKDVQEGKDVRMEDYLETKKHYDNKLSRFGYKLSSTISSSVKHFLKGTFDVIYEWMKE